MPSSLTYPGVYVEEIPSGVRTIVAVPTSVTAFVGLARKGPTNQAIEITNFGDFERIFGGLWARSAMSFAVRDFYLNGGARAVIVRLVSPNLDDGSRAKADAAAKNVADAASAAANGKDAKAAAAKAADAIGKGPTVTPAETEAAKAAAAQFNGLADDADKNAIAKAAAAASASMVRTIAVGDDKSGVTFVAKSPGRWAANLRVLIERPLDATGAASASAGDAAKALGVTALDLFTLTVSEDAPNGAREVFQNVTFVDSPRRVDSVLAEESALVSWGGAPPPLPSLSTIIPDPKSPETSYVASKGDAITEAQLAAAKARKVNPDPQKDPYKSAQKAMDDAINTAIASITDGGDLGPGDFLPNGSDEKKTGLHSLEQLYTRGSLFNLLCLPAKDADIDPTVMDAAAVLCEQRRAMLIVDSPTKWKDISTAANNFGQNTENLPRTRNAAVYFPRLRQSNPFNDDRIEEFAPCGVVAGIFARTDTQRGVWKSPAGLDASLVGVSGLSVPMSDEENGRLNPMGINCLRTFPVFGRVIWGARTLRGADDYADEYKYVAVRRTALFIEESLFRGLKWVVFEPNDEPLWAQIRLNVGAFMNNLFRQGAFQGASPRDAYFVKCDSSTTTQNDINLGIVNIVVGFAPLKPAEFVVIKLQQMVGQIAV
jgi:phage tail sheath protein FI